MTLLLSNVIDRRPTCPAIMAIANGVAPALFCTVVSFLALILSKMARASFASPFQAACGDFSILSTVLDKILGKRLGDQKLSFKQPLTRIFFC